jgi:hypothetical protein
MHVGAGNLRQVLAGLLAHADTGVTAIGHQAREAIIVAFRRNQDVIESALTGPQSLCNRVNAVENFHSSSVDGRV